MPRWPRPSGTRSRRRLSWPASMPELRHARCYLKEMHAVTLTPGKAGSQRMEDVAEPVAAQGSILVRALAVGVCGTDRELIDGLYGQAVPGGNRLVLGHESLGRVISAPPHSGFMTGDMVVGIVRHPDPVPCPNCALGEWDMCRNGRYTERGIKQADGFAAERWRSDPGFTVKVTPVLGLAAVLLEPASVLAKAWEHMDRNESGPKPQLVRELGATYHREFPAVEPDIVIECTGSPAIIVQAVGGSAPGSIVCLTGLGGRQHDASFDVAKLNQSMVLENRVVFGTVNANLRHYHAAADALSHANRAWLDRLITRRVNLGRWEEAYAKQEGDVKTVLLFED